MNQKTLITISLGIVFTGLILFGAYKWFSPQASEVKKETTRPKVALEIFSQPVWVQIGGEKKEAVDGQEIQIGNKIITGNSGRAQILYPNKTVTRLDFNTEITLEKFELGSQQVVIKLETNRIWSRVAKLLGKDSYQSKSNTVVATVRGTSYGHEILSSGKNKISSTRGEIDGECINKTQEALVPESKKALFGCNQGEKVEVDSILTTDKDEWYQFNNTEDEKLNSRFGIDIYKDESKVLGEEIEILPQELFTPTFIATPNFVNCVGPDGKTAFAPQSDCNNLLKFWREHPPAPYTGGGGGSTSTSSTSSVSPSPSASPSALPDVTGPTITNFLAIPASFSAFPCDATFKANITDLSNVLSADVWWKTFTATGSNITSGTTAMSGPASGGLWIGNLFGILLPANGYIDWSVKAYDNLSNFTITPSGLPIYDTSGSGCN